MPASLTLQVRLGFSLGWRIWTPNEVGFYTKTLAHSYFILVILKSKFLKNKLWIVNYNLFIGTRKYYVFVEFLKFGMKSKEERSFWKKILYTSLLIRHSSYTQIRKNFIAKHVRKTKAAYKFFRLRKSKYFADKKWRNFVNKKVFKKVLKKIKPKIKKNIINFYKNININTRSHEHNNKIKKKLVKLRGLIFGKIAISKVLGLKLKKPKNINHYYKRLFKRKNRMANVIMLKKKKFRYILKNFSFEKVVFCKKNKKKKNRKAYPVVLKSYFALNYCKCFKVKKYIKFYSDQISTLENSNFYKFDYDRLEVIFENYKSKLYQTPRKLSVTGGPRKRLTRNLIRAFKGKYIKNILNMVWFWEKIAKLVSYYIKFNLKVIKNNDEIRNI